MSKKREQLKEIFLREFDKLNENQKKAVSQIEGPVMVIAGPGTGKTQILAIRIGKILLETDALPQNILCLTYTDAGAVAMRERLIRFIGTDAYKVNISTFHAFCNQIIQENPGAFNKFELNPIDDLEKARIMKEIISTLPNDHELKKFKGNLYYYSGALSRLFSDIKRENWTVAYLEEKIKEYVESLPYREQFVYKRNSGKFKKGDLKELEIKKEKEKMDRLLAAVKLFTKYEALMDEYNYYDFDDMINWVIKAFDTRPELLADYQERYQYILVDEYQDTSGSQNYLVEQLISYWDRPNIFVVGDDDQSIYRFQGANVKNMEDFFSRYDAFLSTVVLTENYRSTQPILNISTSLIAENQERLINKRKGLSKDLVSSNPDFKNLTHLPEVHEYDSVKLELLGIAQRISDLVASGVQPCDIAVIFRENKPLVELLNILRVKNIPGYCKRSLNLLDTPFCNNFIDIIRYIAAEYKEPFSGEELLFKILHFEFFKISPLEIAKLTAAIKYEENPGKRKSLREAINEKLNTPPATLFDQSLSGELQQAAEVLECLIKAVPNNTILSLMDKIVRETGLLQYIMNHEEKIWMLQMLTAIYDFVKAETSRNPMLSPADLVDVIDLMRAENIPLPLVQVTGSNKGVNLLTAHGSKGLEFEYVFLGGTAKEFWTERKSNYGFRFPDTIIPSNSSGSDEEEARRLFYVAITRAKKYLYISYPAFSDAGKPYEKSVFVTSILDNHPEIKVQKQEISAEIQALYQAAMFEYDARPELQKIEEDFITRLLEKFEMNVTALNNYLDCPLKFYYNNLIRIPSAKNEYTEFGSAVHYALYMLFSITPATGNILSKDAFIGEFRKYMQRRRENFTEEVFKNRMAYGEKILGEYYDARAAEFHRKVKVEDTVKTVLNNIPLKGKIDKIEFFDNGINVVDYKTGSYENARKKFNPPDPHKNDPHGGDYWRQAVFYKILIENSYQYRNQEVSSVEFDFVEPTESDPVYPKRKVEISPEDERIVSEQIRSTWEKIHNRDFYTGCGDPDCSYCNFVKQNKLFTKLHAPEPEEEELENYLNEAE
jgi:DNA helicase-2/ATP-dependent DNA helicase PcrA